MHKSGVSIIIPTFNEANTIRALVSRIVGALKGSGTSFEIIIIDDHSTDETRTIVKELQRHFPVEWRVKTGRRGKGYSILEGARIAQYRFVAMIDADLQYPPEILPEMYTLAQKTGVAVARRKTYKGSIVRAIASRVNAFFFGRLLLNMSTDVQSGFKIFHREVFDHLDHSLISAWAIDIPLLFTAYELGYRPGHVDIEFNPRESGSSNVQIVKTGWEIASGAVRTRFSNRTKTIAGGHKDSMAGAGLAHKRKRYITHTTLAHHLSAFIPLTFWQQFVIAGLLICLALGLITNTLFTAIICVAIISAIYFADVIFNVFVILKSLHSPPDIKILEREVSGLKNSDLPVYTILCPLYKEASVLGHFVDSMKNIDWPKDKLDILLLLEEDDIETINAATELHLSDEYRIIVVPDSLPKTKPKACNYGLTKARGDYVVVFDAEDRPDPHQLKKAFVAFQKSDPNIVCIQAKLGYYNPHDNMLTRLFTAEYSLWFDVVLPGLQSIQTTIPLGGTSNHFRTADLLSLKGWDPFNVTEDADLGARLFRHGFKTAIIDSTTLEEANNDIKNWFRQRSRWIKGYIQTYFVHFRNPLSFVREYGRHALLFQLIVGGKIAFMLINPLLWIITISYFALYSIVGPTIEAVYPASIFYMAVTSLVFGNFIHLYNYMIGLAKRNHWDLVKYVFLVPIYWLMISISAGIAVFQFLVKPFYWEKTVHGLHLELTLSRQKSDTGRFSISALTKNPFFIGGGLLIVSTLGSNILNFLYNVYLGRSITLAEFGTVSLIGSLLYIANVAFGSLNRTVTHRSAYLLGKYKKPVSHFWFDTRKKTLKIAGVVSVLWLLFTPLLMLYFRTDKPLPFLLFTPIWYIGTALSVDMGFLNGTHRFSIFALVMLSEALVKLLLSIVIVSMGFSEFVYAAIPFSMFIALSIAYASASRIISHEVNVHEQAQVTTWPRKFFVTSVISSLTTISFLSLDLLLAKHYLSPTEAGSYALLTLVGKMVFFLSSVFSQFTVPVISRQLGEKNSSDAFPVILLLVTGVNIVAVFLFGIFGHLTVPFLWGPQTVTILPYLPFYTVGMALYSVASLVISFNQIKGRYVFPVMGFLLSLIQIAGIFIFHDSIGVVVGIISISSLFTIIGVILLHVFYDQLVTVYRNALDLLGLFSTRSPIAVKASGKLRILIFNWRDLKHKWAGGAEVYIHELSKRWVNMGHDVTVFCGNDQHSPRYETVDGIRIIRRGGFYTVYVWAFLYYIRFFRGNVDVIIDCENGIPFFTPLYANARKYLLIHHVHQEVFRKSLIPPFSWIAMFLERYLMPLTYRNTNLITVSPSSKAEILAHKITSKEPAVIYNGINKKVYLPGEKSPIPTILYVGRLTALKSIHVLIKASKNIIQAVPDVRIIIAGEGADRRNLERLVSKYNLQAYFQFTGRVTEPEKILLYQRAWVFVNPSLIEGWGITTIEANACGTPVVASNVPGLRDAVNNPHSGILIPYGNSKEFASAISELLTNATLRKRMSRESVMWASRFDWDKSAKDAMEILMNGGL